MDADGCSYRAAVAAAVVGFAVLFEIGRGRFLAGEGGSDVLGVEGVAVESGGLLDTWRVKGRGNGLIGHTA